MQVDTMRSRAAGLSAPSEYGSIGMVTGSQNRMGVDGDTRRMESESHTFRVLILDRQGGRIALFCYLYTLGKYWRGSARY